MRIFSTGLAAFLGLALAGTASAQLSTSKGISSQKGTPGIQQKGPANSPGTRSASSLGNMLTVLGATGSDDCNTPDAISGTGSFAFDLTGATTGPVGQTETLCDAFGTTGIGSDVWFAWTATASGTATVTTCGTTTVDTKIAAYPGSACPAPGSALACNDDVCSLQSTISFPVNTGSTYMLQIGTFPGAAQGSGTFDISISGLPPNDDCATPTAIAGPGPHPFDNLLATTGSAGQNEILCDAFGTTGIANDVWFTWTAPQTALTTLSTCGQTSVDTKIAVYGGAGCPANGTSIACNDDACSLQSSVTFAATAGDTYTIQIGTFPGAAGGMGTFTLTAAATNDDCSNPDVIAGVGSFPFDLTGLTTGSEGQNEVLCTAFGTTGIGSDAWFAWTAPSSGVATVDTCGVTFDTKIAAYPGDTCPVDGTAIACNDDFCGLQSSMDFPVIAGATYMLQIGTFPGAPGGPGSFNINIADTGPGASFCAGDGSGSVPCPCGNTGGPGRGCDNGTGSGGALLSATGSNSISAADVTLTVNGSDPLSLGLFFSGNDAVNNGNGLAFGDGLRCVGGGIGRLDVVFADAAGNVSAPLGAPGTSPGQVQNYQWWYRAPFTTVCGSGFNLSNAYSIVWAP